MTGGGVADADAEDAVVGAASGRPVVDGEPVLGGEGVAVESSTRGKDIYAGACAGCHGWTGESPLASQATLVGGRAINDPTAKNVALIVLHGSEFAPSDGSIAMPAFGAAYSDREVAAVTNYVTARFGAKASAVTPEEVAKMRAMQ